MCFLIDLSKQQLVHGPTLRSSSTLPVSRFAYILSTLFGVRLHSLAAADEFRRKALQLVPVMMIEVLVRYFASNSVKVTTL